MTTLKYAILIVAVLTAYTAALIQYFRRRYPPAWGPWPPPTDDNTGIFLHVCDTRRQGAWTCPVCHKPWTVNGTRAEAHWNPGTLGVLVAGTMRYPDGTETTYRTTRQENPT